MGRKVLKAKLLTVSLVIVSVQVAGAQSLDQSTFIPSQSQNTGPIIWDLSTSDDTRKVFDGNRQSNIYRTGSGPYPTETTYFLPDATLRAQTASQVSSLNTTLLEQQNYLLNALGADIAGNTVFEITNIVFPGCASASDCYISSFLRTDRGISLPLRPVSSASGTPRWQTSATPATGVPAVNWLSFEITPNALYERQLLTASNLLINGVTVLSTGLPARANIPSSPITSISGTLSALPKRPRVNLIARTAETAGLANDTWEIRYEGVDPASIQLATTGSFNGEIITPWTSLGEADRALSTQLGTFSVTIARPSSVGRAKTQTLKVRATGLDGATTVFATITVPLR